MLEESKIEELNCLDKPELVKLFSQAFRGIFFNLLKNFIQEQELSIKVEKVLLELEEVFAEFEVNFYMSMKRCWVYGIRQENKVVCVSISVDTTEKLSLITYVRLVPIIIPLIIQFIRIAFIVERYSTMDIIKFVITSSKEKPKYKDKYLELVVLGTLPAYQKQGFGQEMLHFLYDKAKKEGYRGIILVTMHNWPAFHLYLREGFIIDKEFKFREIKEYWMRFEC